MNNHPLQDETCKDYHIPFPNSGKKKIGQTRMRSHSATRTHAQSVSNPHANDCPCAYMLSLSLLRTVGDAVVAKENNAKFYSHLKK